MRKNGTCVLAYIVLGAMVLGYSFPVGSSVYSRVNKGALDSDNMIVQQKQESFDTRLHTGSESLVDTSTNKKNVREKSKGTKMIAASNDTAVQVPRLTGDELYNPVYFQKLGTGAVVSDEDLVGFEQAIVSGLKKKSKRIDVKKYKIGTEVFFDYYQQILHNHQELYYVDGGCSYYRDSTSTTNVGAIMPQYLAETEVAAFEKSAKKALSRITPDMKDYEKALVLHDYLTTYCEYDYANYNRNSIPQESYTAYGALVNRVAVCQGYALAYQYLLYKAGVSATYVGSSSMGHAWNMVKINGHYYHVDVTWDDPVPDSIGKAKHEHFLLSDEEMEAQGYSDWVSTYVADDDSFKNAQWKEASGAVVPYDGEWYYSVYEGSEGCALVKTRDLLESESTTVHTYGRWGSNHSYWIATYTFPALYEDVIVFNTPKSILIYDPKTNEIKPTTVELSESDNNCIYAFDLRDDKVRYIVGESSSSSSNTIYQKNMSEMIPQESGVDTLTGTVTIDGIARYGHTLTASASITTDSFTDDDQSNLVYQWYRDGVKMDDATTSEYSIESDDIDCELSVKVSCAGYSGTIKSTAVDVEKEISVVPSDDSLSYEVVKGSLLSDIILPAGYTWVDDSSVLNKVGENQVFHASYCVNPLTHSSVDVEVLVTVVCAEHQWDEGVVTKEATKTSTGIKTETCKVCKKTRSIIIPIVPEDDSKKSEDKGVSGSNTETSGNNTSSSTGDTGATGDNTSGSIGGTGATGDNTSSSTGGTGATGNETVANNSGTTTGVSTTSGTTSNTNSSTTNVSSDNSEVENSQEQEEQTIKSNVTPVTKNRTVVATDLGEDDGDTIDLEDDEDSDFVTPPAKVNLIAVKNKKGRKLVITFKKCKNVDGYEISISRNKKFVAGKFIKRVSRNMITLKAKKKGVYYVRVRAYRFDFDGDRVYGKYSSTKKVKIKK